MEFEGYGSQEDGECNRILHRPLLDRQFYRHFYYSVLLFRNVIT